MAEKDDWGEEGDWEWVEKPEEKPKEKSYYEQILDAARGALDWDKAGKPEESPPPQEPPQADEPQTAEEQGVTPNPEFQLPQELTPRQEALLREHGPGSEVGVWYAPGREPPPIGDPNREEWFQGEPRYTTPEAAEEAAKSGLDEEVRAAMARERALRIEKPQPTDQFQRLPFHGQKPRTPLPISHQSPTPKTGQPPAETAPITPSKPPTPKEPLEGKGGELTEAGERELRELYRKSPEGRSLL